MKRWQVAAALSAAVTATKPIGDTPNSQAETTKKKSRTPNASCSSGEGVWGGGASLREAASSPESRPHKSLREGARGRSFSQRSCLPRIPPHVPFLCSYFLSFYFYFVVKFIRTICTQALPNDWFCRTIGARSKRGGYLG